MDEEADVFAGLPLGVEGEGVLNDGVGVIDGEDVIDDDAFVFEGFVIFEEAFEDGQLVRGELVDVMVAVELGVIDVDGDDFVIHLVLVFHGHQADGAGGDEAEGGDGFGTEDEDVEGVAIVGEGLGDEAVVGGVVDGGVQDAVELEEAGFFVELVFVGGAKGDFDDGVELRGEESVAGRDIVPGGDGAFFFERGELGHRGLLGIWLRGTSALVERG